MNMQEDFATKVTADIKRYKYDGSWWICKKISPQKLQQTLRGINMIAVDEYARRFRHKSYSIY